MARFFCFFIMFIFFTTSQLIAKNCSNCEEEVVFVETDEGDEVCTRCGCVNAERAIAEGDLGEKKDFNADASEFGPKKSKSRIATLNSAHQTTAIAFTEHEGSHGLRKTQKFMQNNKEQKIREMAVHINNICTLLHHGNKVKNTAYNVAEMLENVRKNHARTGDQAMAAAIILYSLKHHQRAYGFKEMAQAINIDEKLIIRNFKTIRTKVQQSGITLNQPKPAVSSDQLPGLIEKICGKLFTNPVQRMAVINAAVPHIENFSSQLEGKNPKTVAATCVHQALKEVGLTTLQKELAEAAKIAPNTLRSAISLIENQPSL